MEDRRTENRKLIYELSKIAKSSESAMGLIYYKDSLTPEGNARRIWAKRASKKGYCDIKIDNDSYYLFSINEKGLELLRNFPQFYLLKNKKVYYEKELTIKERRELRRKQRENLI
jgi:hypothetical protein